MSELETGYYKNYQKPNYIIKIELDLQRIENKINSIMEMLQVIREKNGVK